jgi:hypothetical protein
MSNVDEARKRIFIELHGRLARAVIDAGQAIPGECDGALRVDPYLAATNAMRVLPKVVFFDDSLRERLREQFSPVVAQQLFSVLGLHAVDPETFDATPEGPEPGRADVALAVFDNGADGGDWVERAIADGILSRERSVIGLHIEDVDRLTRSVYANCTLLVRFRSSKADGRMVMTANDVVALEQSTGHDIVERTFDYDEIRDIFPLRFVDDAHKQPQAV